VALEVGEVVTRLSYRVDDHGADRYERRVKDLRNLKDVRTDADLRVDQRGFNEYGKRVKEVERHHGDLIKSGGRVRTGFGQIWGAGGAAFAAAGGAYALVAGVKGVISAYGESQKIGKQTEAVLKSTGGAAHVTAKQVDDLSGSISRKTGFDDEAIKSGENLLLTFTGIRNEAGKGNDIFTQSTGIMADMSRALGQDMKSSAIQLGKALNDPIKGVTALQRVGVSFTASQKDTIKHLVETGQKVKAQKLILGELRKEFGGSAAAYGKTLPGALDKAKVAFGNVAESIGKRLAPWLTKGATFLSKMFTQLEKGKGPLAAAGRFIGEVATKIGRFVGKVAEAASGGGRLARIWDNVKKAFSGFSDGGFVTFLGHAIVSIVRFASKVLSAKAGLVVLQGVIGAIVGRAAALAAVWAVGKVVAFVGAIGKAVGALVSVRRGVQLTSAALSKTPWGAIGTVIGIVAGALGVFSSGEDKAKTSADDLTGALHDQADALRGLRDTDLDAAQAKASLKSANVSLELAERRVNALRRAGKLNTIEGRQAEADLAQARVGQKRATRDLGDQEANANHKRFDAIKATKDSIKATKDRINTLGNEIVKGGLAGKQVKDLSGKMAELKRLQASMPSLAGKLHDLEHGASNARGPVSNLRGAVDSLGGALRYLAARQWVFHVGLAGVSAAGRQLTNLAAQATIPVHVRAQGGKVGPSVGGPKLFVAGEGKKDEWVISQEGDRQRNVEWAIEALQAITGRTVGLFAGGGRVRGAATRHGTSRGSNVATYPDIWQIVGNGTYKSIPTREGQLGAVDTAISRKDREYGQMDRRFNFSQEDILVEHDDGSVTVDQAQLNQRGSELDQLITKKGEIKQQLESLTGSKGILSTLIALYDRAVKNLNYRIGKHPKDKNHSQQVSTRDRYSSRRTDLKGRADELDLDIGDIQLDIDELNNEKTNLGLGTRAPLPTDSGSSGGGGGDTGGGDTVELPPSPLEIAQAAAGQLDAFKGAVQDAVSSFGSNFRPSGAPAGSDPLAALTGAGYFGAGGGGQGVFGAGPAIGAGITVEGPLVEQHFGSPPPAHLWTDETVRGSTGAF
jgi:hypothetical protein